MLFQFGNVLVFAIVGIAFVGVNLLLGRLLRPNNPQGRKLASYECGEPPVGTARMNFNLRFYIIALVFIIFEVEIVLVFPVATVFRDWTIQGKGLLAWIEVFVFVGILFLGLLYAWVKGDLDWIKRVKGRIA
jgi:NADH-quinone oxidoreductase subunit A